MITIIIITNRSNDDDEEYVDDHHHHDKYKKSWWDFGTVKFHHCIALHMSYVMIFIPKSIDDFGQIGANQRTPLGS